MLLHLNQLLSVIVSIHSIYPLVRMALPFVTGSTYFLSWSDSKISIVVLLTHVNLLPLEENQSYSSVVMIFAANTKIRAAISLLLLIQNSFEKIDLKRINYCHLAFFWHYFVLDSPFY